MATNPLPARISPAIWHLWEEFRAYLDSAQLGGVYAGKPGYHNYPDALPSSDYSLRDVAGDRAGPRNFASALDITLGDADMRLHTRRLDVAARVGDERLFVPGRGPVLREFIGTLDSRTVYCYVLVGGRPLGVGADAGADPGREKTHLWHIHLSIIRKFCDDWPALDGVLSVLRGEPLEKWRERTEDVTPEQAGQLRDSHYTLAKAIPNPVGDGRVPLHVWAAWVTATLKTLPAQVGNVDEATRQQLAGDFAKLVDAINSVDENVIASLPGRTDGDLVRVLTELLGEDRARRLGALLVGAAPA